MSDELESINSAWSIEIDDSFWKDIDRFRIISDSDRERWKEYNTTARVPYIATVYSKKIAILIVEDHNNKIRCSGEKNE